ncbi:G-protein alpha subunit-domain-containing protein [Aspergillus oleicola]
MDPISVLGAVGSILGIMDVVTRSIKTLNEFQGRYATVSLRTRSFVGHLSTLNAALGQIKQLLPLVDSNRSNEDGSQIATDVAVSLGCCEEIMLFMDQRLSQLRMQKDKPSMLDKMAIVWNESETLEFQTLLNNQVNAMNLLLSALQCKSLLEQRDFLERAESRVVFSRVKDDASSLLWLRDSDSEITMKSTPTERLSLVSARFSFDSDLFDSRVYRSAARLTMRQAIHGTASSPLDRAQSILDDNATESSLSVLSNEEAAAWGPIERTVNYHQSISNAETSSLGEIARRAPNLASVIVPTRQRSQTASSVSTSHLQSRSQWLSSIALHRVWGLGPSLAPDVAPKSTFKQTQAQPRVIFLGTSKSGKSSAFNALSLLVGPPTNAHLFHSRTSILLSVNSQLHRLLQTGKELSLNKPDMARKWASLCALSATVTKSLDTLHYHDTSDQQQGILAGISHDMRHIHACVQRYRLLDQSSNPDLEDGVEYFMNEIDRITELDYKPSFEDTMWCYTKSTGGIITRYTNRTSQVLFCDVGGTRSERKKWMHFAPGASKIFYFIDTGSYNQQLTEDNASNRLLEERDTFIQVCQNQQFRHAEIVLFLHKLDKLERKLKNVPFINQGYTGDPRSSHDVVGFLYEAFTNIAAHAGRTITVRFTTLSRPEAFAKTILSCALLT